MIEENKRCNSVAFGFEAMELLADGGILWIGDLRLHMVFHDLTQKIDQ